MRQNSHSADSWTSEFIGKKEVVRRKEKSLLFWSRESLIKLILNTIKLECSYYQILKTSSSNIELHEGKGF